MNGSRGRFLNCLALNWRSIVAVLVPIVLAPVFLLPNNFPDDPRISKWLYVVSIMIIFWVTEALPHSVTSLVPIGLFPLLQIMDTAATCKLYVHETVFTLLGSLIIASSIEACNLHKRIALKVLCHVKCCHRRLHFVLMAITMFISMWFQNFTVVAMMSSVCLIILEQPEIKGTTTLTVRPNEAIVHSDEVLRPTRIAMGYLLGITYAATLGGCGSLLGTPTNLSFKGIFETYFPVEIDYLRFFHYCAPIMLLNTILTWFWLQVLFMGLLRPMSNDAAALYVTEDGAKAVKENIILNYRAMGRLTAAEIQVTVMFVLYHLALTFRSHHLVQKLFLKYELQIVGDASLTILFVILFFVIPSAWNCCRKSADDDDPREESQSVLTWTLVRRKVPWGLIFLLGAGIALAESGRILEIHKIFENLIDYDTDTTSVSLSALSFSVCLWCQIFTEFVSNAPAANVVLPLLAAFCVKLGVKSLNLMFPAALCLNMSFHTRIGTPGNAYVAGLIDIHIKDMLYCGIGPSIITLLTYWSTFPTYGTYIFDKEPKELNNATTAT